MRCFLGCSLKERTQPSVRDSFTRPTLGSHRDTDSDTFHREITDRPGNHVLHGDRRHGQKWRIHIWASSWSKSSKRKSLDLFLNVTETHMGDSESIT